MESVNNPPLKRLMDKHRKLSFSSTSSEDSEADNSSQISEVKHNEVDEPTTPESVKKSVSKNAHKPIDYDLEDSPHEQRLAVMNAGTFFDKENMNQQNEPKSDLHRRENTSYRDDLFSGMDES